MFAADDKFLPVQFGAELQRSSLETVCEILARYATSVRKKGHSPFYDQWWWCLNEQLDQGLLKAYIEAMYAKSASCKRMGEDPGKAKTIAFALELLFALRVSEDTLTDKQAISKATRIANLLVPE